MDHEIIEFLQQSNYIENEPSSEALDDSIKAWNYLIKKPTLNKGRIFHTHKLLMKSRTTIPEELKGAWRKPVGNLTGNVRVGGQAKYPWYQVPMEMDLWIDAINNMLTSKYIKENGQKEGAAVAMHILFEQIHPFLDGNGRMGRILMNWQLQKMGLPILVIYEDKKQEYYQWFK